MDVQCIMPALGDLSGCFHTKFISTSPKAKFPGATHIEFHEEHAYDIAREIVRTAVENYRFRKAAQVRIPDEKMDCMVGFSVEAIVSAMGGKLDPLLEAVKSGAIMGIAAVVGCNNVKVRHDYSHINLVRELIRNDVLVVTTGQSSGADDCPHQGKTGETGNREGACRPGNKMKILQAKRV